MSVQLVRDPLAYYGGDAPRSSLGVVENPIDVFAGCQNRAPLAVFLGAATTESYVRGAAYGALVGLALGVGGLLYWQARRGA